MNIDMHHQTDASHGDGQAHGTRRSYLTGFILSVLLTAIPFWLVMSGMLGNTQVTALSIVALAVIQIVVHMVFFLHMNAKSESGWTMMALIFTLVLVMIVLIGSLWVMYHLNANMMAMPNNDMSQMP